MASPIGESRTCPRFSVVQDPISDGKDIFRAKDWRRTMLIVADAITRAVEGLPS
jgi:hypothetical protein